MLIENHRLGTIARPQTMANYRVTNKCIIFLHFMYKNLSGDEIANVNFFMTRSHMYFKIPKQTTYFI